MPIQTVLLLNPIRRLKRNPPRLTDESGSATELWFELQNPTHPFALWCREWRRTGFSNPNEIRVAEPSPSVRCWIARHCGSGSATLTRYGLPNPARLLAAELHATADRVLQPRRNTGCGTRFLWHDPPNWSFADSEIGFKVINGIILIGQVPTPKANVPPKSFTA